MARGSARRSWAGARRTFDGRTVGRTQSHAGRDGRPAGRRVRRCNRGSFSATSTVGARRPGRSSAELTAGRRVQPRPVDAGGHYCSSQPPATEWGPARAGYATVGSASDGALFSRGAASCAVFIEADSLDGAGATACGHVDRSAGGAFVTPAGRRTTG